MWAHEFSIFFVVLSRTLLRPFNEKYYSNKLFLLLFLFSNLFGIPFEYITPSALFCPARIGCPAGSVFVISFPFFFRLYSSFISNEKKKERNKTPGIFP
jgi:hypothetical protein